jgi:hypothetical protein
MRFPLPLVGREEMLRLSDSILHELSRETEQRPPGARRALRLRCGGHTNITCRPQLKRQEFTNSAV